MEKYLKLYGVLTQVMPEGECAVCKPIYTDYWEKKPTKFYRLKIKSHKNKWIFNGYEIVDFYELYEVDIGEYGKPQFLPLSKNKIGDGKEYFVIFQESKCLEEDFDFPLTFYYNDNGDGNTYFLNIGIKFPKTFFVADISYKEILVDEKVIKQYYRG